MEPGSPDDDDPATDDDIRDAIEALSHAESLRLRSAARALLLGTEYQDPQELVNEAIRRAFDASEGLRGRRWPKRRVPFVAFVIMSMKSIADGSRESDLMARTDRLQAMVLADASADEVLDRLGFWSNSVEVQALDAEQEAEAIACAKADAQQLEAMFAADQEVAWLIECIKDGRSPAKAREIAGFTTTEYETIRKRLRRGAAKLFPGRRVA